MLKAIWGFAVLSMTLVITTIAFGGKNAKSDIPPHGEAVVLFNGRDLTNFDTFLKEHGLNNDPDHVFLVENGVIHISGKEFGYVITKKEFARGVQVGRRYVRSARGAGAGQRDFISRAGRAEGLAEIGRVSNH
jgi:hypothetical protein